MNNWKEVLCNCVLVCIRSAVMEYELFNIWIMKKSKIVFLLSVLSVSALTCIVNVQGNPFSVYASLALKNVEALAGNEGGATGTTTGEYVYYDFDGRKAEE